MFGNLTDNNVNLDKLPEDGSTPKGGDKATDVDLSNFFLAMEQQVNGAVYETEPTVTPEGPLNVDLDPVQPTVVDEEPTSEPAETSDEVKKIREELDDLKQRYSDSSAEAKRLYNENKELERYKDYIPILEEMRGDPGLINHVRNYLEGNTTPTTVKNELDLPEDFIFDGDEAVRDPDSQSGKVFRNLVDKAVEQRLKQHTQVEKQQRQQWEQEQAQQVSLDKFREEMDMNTDEFSEFVDFAKGRKLTLEDIYYLKNRENREKAIAKNAIEEHNKQLKKMRGVPQSMASDGGYTENVDQEKIVFEAVAKAANSMNIFGE
jgi:hypothetical protein